MRDMRRSTCSVPNPSGVAEDRDFEDVFEYIRQEEEAEEDIVATLFACPPSHSPQKRPTNHIRPVENAMLSGKAPLMRLVICMLRCKQPSSQRWQVQADRAKRARLRCERDARIKEELERGPEAERLACETLHLTALTAQRLLQAVDSEVELIEVGWDGAQQSSGAHDTRKATPPTSPSAGRSGKLAGSMTFVILRWPVKPRALLERSECSLFA